MHDQTGRLGSTVQQTAGATVSQELASSNPRSVTIHCTALGKLLNLLVSQFHHL